jgi:hypothetical protein
MDYTNITQICQIKKIYVDFFDRMDIIGVTPPGDTPYTQGINCS